ncbi:MAG: hypothetical protein M3O73_01205 [Actinomycetota bacterium]|nr:hypothetical protein [Actinomycetota bacterium]
MTPVASARWCSDLRHTYASLLIAQGAHAKLISEQLGHSGISITIDRYGHLIDQSYDDATDVLEETLFGGPPASGLQAGRETAPQRSSAPLVGTPTSA